MFGNNQRRNFLDCMKISWGSKLNLLSEESYKMMHKKSLFFCFLTRCTVHRAITNVMRMEGKIKLGQWIKIPCSHSPSLLYCCIQFNSYTIGNAIFSYRHAPIICALLLLLLLLASRVSINFLFPFFPRFYCSCFILPSLSFLSIYWSVGLGFAT